MEASFSPIWCLMEDTVYLCITPQSSPAPLISSLVHLNGNKNQNTELQQSNPTWLRLGELEKHQIPIFGSIFTSKACPLVQHGKFLK